MEAPAGVLPGEVRPSPPLAASWLTLFNQERFHLLNLRDGLRPLSVEATDDAGRVVGTFGGVVDGDTLVSGWSAPFGGVDLARERETPANVARVVDTALARFAAEGVRTVRVKLPPAHLGESEPLVQFTLLNRGFAVERCELNQHLDLTGVGGAEDYMALLRSPARRQLRRLLGPEFTVARCATPAERDRAYAVLAANRAAKGRALSLSRAYVERACEVFPQHVRMLALRHGDDTVAAALVYRVRERRDLVVAWGDDAPGLERSPMNLLALRVVEDALADGVRTIDLGISNGQEPDAAGALVPDDGLVQFKRSIGAVVEPRLTLAREL